MRNDKRSTKSRKLTLATQTVRALDPAALALVTGGLTTTYKISVGLCD